PFQRQHVPRKRKTKSDSLRRRYIVDRFQATFQSSISAPGWERKLKDRLTEVMLLLERGKSDDISKARNMVNRMVADMLGDLEVERLPVLYPVEIRVVNEATPYTTLHVVSQDTPAFLYALSNALSRWSISIEYVRIKTVHDMVEDVIGILDSRGDKILQSERLDQIRLSVLLTKQFTLFLANAPDPYAALSRFEYLSSDIVGLPERGEWQERFSDPHTLHDLARILGASDFIWEDFIRSQYETLLPMLSGESGGRRISFIRVAMKKRLEEALAGTETFEQKRERLNAWKDHEIFLIDLDHMLHSGADVRALAEPLTRLAEIVVQTATDAVYQRLIAKYGTPRTVGGLKAEFAVFGLGKMGGVALGYASDIELLFVYSDNGKTDSENPIDNSEFFNHLVDEISRFITSKREGIFDMDLRLRPYGDSGPKACSMESFIRYYGFPGEAHSYERLALTRLRAICGNQRLGRQIERLRDEFVYSKWSLVMDELRELRERQFVTKAKGPQHNAKFSPGALVDLEYYVQILQVIHGADAHQVRTPRIHEALAALSRVGILEVDESTQLTEAYYFLRHLINGLRMLRGHALDLFLPPYDSDEYSHLARRMGYQKNMGLNPGKRLFVDFETHTGIIRAFIEKYFGRDSIPDSEHGNVVDLVLSPDVSPVLRDDVLSKSGLLNIQRGFVNLQKLAGTGAQRDTFARLAILAFDMLKRVPDPDMALNNWERFVGILPDTVAHYGLLLSQPRRLEMLLGIFAGSQFLADTLVRSPEFLDWVTDPDILRGPRSRARLGLDLQQFISEESEHQKWMNSLRRFRRREILRIGTRDICLHAPIEDIMTGLSALADTIVEAALAKVWEEASVPQSLRNPQRYFCILSLGKLGGSELNYSSDIDLLGIYNDEGLDIPPEQARDLFARVLEKLRASLSEHTQEGYAYRVDLRLRPYGAYGELVQSCSFLVEYYAREAALWEIQAIMKARPIAGALDIGYGFIEDIKPMVMQKRERRAIVSSIKGMRDKAIQVKSGSSRSDVKSGIGGIRDVEFLVQGLQLVHFHDHPELFTGNTLSAMAILEKIGILSSDVVTALRDDYLFLRRVEHYLQLLEDRQIHDIPHDPAQLAALSRRALDQDTSSSEFMSKLETVQDWIHRAYDIYLV
ncbi:MAG: glutamate-ammonia-ligase adenylyltransferase, partial [Chloroflexota bacterium]|nr:glutamate-ammonia-ligase adenylyltransferase [Chloroflexota bacterium]